MGVDLGKGQSVVLAKRDGSTLTRVRMATGWDVARTMFGRQKPVDLDASAMIFGPGRALLDQVYFKQLKSKDGAVVHTGDNRTGQGVGDAESIVVDLVRLQPEATALVFVVNSFSGQDFSKIDNAYCRLVDCVTEAELARFDLSASGRHTAQIMAKLSRGATGWTMTAVGHLCAGRTFKDLVPAAKPFL